MASAESSNRRPSELDAGAPPRGTTAAAAVEPGESKPSPQGRAPRTVVVRRTSLLIAFITALASTAVAYLVGWSLQWRNVSQAEDARDNATAQLGAKIQELELRVLRLEARRQLALALTALDERNFGIATEHLSAAGSTIQKAPLAEQMTRLANEIKAFRLVATENLAAQRGKILGWSKTLDGLLSQGR